MKIKTLSIIYIACLLILPIISVLSFSSVVSATPENWSEVARFTGSGTEQYTTAYFTCSHVEWRIRWSYVPDSSHPEDTLFGVFTYPQGEDFFFIDYILEAGDLDTSGISYVHSNKGTFYSKINVEDTQSYTIIIEQDLDSIPELPSFLTLPLLMMASLLAIIAFRRKHSAL